MSNTEYTPAPVVSGNYKVQPCTILEVPEGHFDVIDPDHDDQVVIRFDNKADADAACLKLNTEVDEEAPKGP